MQAVKIFKKFLLPGGLCGAVPMIKPVPTSPETPVECSNETNLIRPSELPLYVAEPSRASCADQESEPSILEQGFGTVRKSFQGVFKEYDAVSTTIKNTVNTGIAHSQGTLDFLREEDNALPRVGAVTLGGLTGLIFSLRGGKFKKLIYTTTGALVVGAVCYPQEFKGSADTLQHYANIAYNFFYGVKPGDEKQLELKWPEILPFKIPTSFSELMNIVSDTGSSAAGKDDTSKPPEEKSTVGNLKKK